MPTHNFMYIATHLTEIMYYKWSLYIKNSQNKTIHTESYLRYMYTCIAILIIYVFMGPRTLSVIYFVYIWRQKSVYALEPVSI